MLNKTALLTYIWQEAQKLAAEDNKKAINSNYFVATCLSLLSEEEKREGFPDDHGTSEAELGTLKLLFWDLPDYRAASDELLSAIHKEGYSSMMDDLLFGKFIYAAEKRVKEEGLSAIGAFHMLSAVLSEPTAPMRACGFVGKEAKVNEQKPIPVSDDADEEKPKDEAEATKEEKPLPQTPAVPKKTGKESLGDSVAMAKKLHSALLSRVYGQDVAIASFVSGYFQSELMSYTRKENKKPAVFLFAGPPGVGKTLLAETAAQALSLPFCRFDMSEYAGTDGVTMFCGSDKVYKDSKAGTVTGFVAKNPHSVLIFDEIEKAHINVIHLFLQILDAGRVRDSYTEKEVPFGNTLLIFTTNAGRSLYEDPSVQNLSSLPKKTVLKALANDRNAATGMPLFPAALCSRFASGNVVMLNHLGAGNLFSIAKRELLKNVEGFTASTEIKVDISDAVTTALMLSEGGKADARTLCGRANAFFHEELYELFRLLSDDKKADCGKKLKQITLDVSLDNAEKDIERMFENDTPDGILLFAEGEMQRGVSDALLSYKLLSAGDVNTAKDILFAQDISLILCDIRTGAAQDALTVLNAEDIVSEGRTFLEYALTKHDIPVYLVTDSAHPIGSEEFLSFAKMGVRGVLVQDAEKGGFENEVNELCLAAYRQSNMLRLAKENKVLTYKTSQTVTPDRKKATIHLFDFRLGLSRDMTDAGNIVEGGSRPSVHFEDVIGASDAKKELAYYIDYLKNPVAYLRKGVHAPKGILLYGPPGTGKTMLARAMAGESNLTFLAAEGNQFLKKYVGEGPQAVHDLFKTARKYAPAILFVDEIDAIGKNRDSGAAEYTADVLTAFLTEMDGFHTDTTKPVFVLAATNYGLSGKGSRTLDPALLRRFDRRIYVDLPNKAERKQFLQKMAEKYPLVAISEQQIDNIALRSTGMSLAELSGVFEMALRGVVREDAKVTDEAFEEAFETYSSGEAKQFSPEELLRTARHEAGHAFLCWQSGETPSYVTVVARGDHGGYMQHGDREQKGSYTRGELLSSIRTALGGRAAEMVYYGEEEGISTGASGDLAQATKTAEHMICYYGMDDSLGLAVVDERGMGLLYPALRERINAVLSCELAKAKTAIAENRKRIDALVSVLLEKNHLRGEQIDRIFREEG